MHGFSRRSLSVSTTAVTLLRLGMGSESGERRKHATAVNSAVHSRAPGCCTFSCTRLHIFQDTCIHTKYNTYRKCRTNQMRD